MRIEILLMCVAAAFAACPHEDPTLTAFSASGLGTGLTPSSNLSITSSILLDEDLDVSYIDISGSGRLVVDRDQNITIEALGIMVRDSAAFVIGSDDCRHTDRVDIILQGERDLSLTTHEGQKYIAVKDQASLLFYGADIPSWTKLSGTAEMYNFNSADVIYDHKSSTFATSSTGAQGLMLYILNGTTLQPKSYGVYDFWRGGNQTLEEAKIAQFIKKLDDVVTGDVVAIAIQRYLKVGDSTDVTTAFDKIESVAGMSTSPVLLRSAEQYDAFAMIFVKDSPNLTHQTIDYQIGKIETLAWATIVHNNYKLSATSYIYAKSDSKAKVNFRALTLAAGNPTINLLTDVSLWGIGEEILLVSTDFSYKHAEVRRIKAKPTSHSLQLEDELLFRHYGHVENNVDMRGEVVRLSRDINVMGEMSRGCPATNENCADVIFDSFGAHLKVMHSFGAVAVDGIGFQNVGQASKIGFYPIHFHMCLNVTGQLALVRRNSIWGSYARAVTVHGTHGTDENNLGVSVIENTAFEIYGHAYFLEDGIEMATLLQGNLGANIKNIKNQFITDGNKATVFWITNPKVLMIGNVAAGADGYGIWYVFPTSPVGPSAGMVYAKFEARHTPLWTNMNNVAHSNIRGGFNFDNILENGFGKVRGCMNYKPVAIPTNKTSAFVKVQIVGLITYKNININCWLRGGLFELIRFSAAESKRAVQLARTAASKSAAQLARGSNQQQSVKKSVIMGKSTGNFEDYDYPDYTRVPHYLGVVFYEGPVQISETAFFGFEDAPDNSFASGALGFKPKNILSSSAASTVFDLRFAYNDTISGLYNRVFGGDIDDEALGFASEDGDRVATFRDMDGSVTKCPADTSWAGPVQVVKPEMFLVTGNCKYRENWKMMACHDLYGKAQVSVLDVFTGERGDFKDSGHMRRVRFDDPTNIEYESHTGDVTPEYMMILRNNPLEYYYEFQYSETTTYTKKVRFTGKGIERGLRAVVGVCLPDGVTRDNLSLRSTMASGVDYMDADMLEVNSIQAVADSTYMNSYYLSGRMLYMKFDTWIPRDPHWDNWDTDHCPQGSCPFFDIELDQPFAYTNCFNPTAAQLNSTVTSIADLGIANLTCDLPAATTPYEENWGAGAWNQPQDGAYGEWSSWSDCCAEGTSTKTRYRVCDNPPPYGSGATCSGPATESQSCDTPCPANGAFGEWSAWGECACGGVGLGSRGAKTRTRSCDGQANFGNACWGSLQEMRHCRAGCEYGPLP